MQLAKKGLGRKALSLMCSLALVVGLMPAYALADDAAAASDAVAADDMVVGTTYVADVEWTGTGNTASMSSIAQSMISGYFGDEVELVKLEDGTYDVTIGFNGQSGYNANIGYLYYYVDGDTTIDDSDTSAETVEGRQNISQDADSQTYTLNVDALDEDIALSVQVTSMTSMFAPGADILMTIDVDSIALPADEEEPEVSGDAVAAWYIGAETASDVTATLYEDGTLAFTGEGATESYSNYTSVPWIADGYAESIVKVTFEDAVAPEKMSFWFYGCTNLTSAEIPEGTTTLNSTFYGCTSLVEAPELPDSATSLKRTFYGCTSLTEAALVPEGATTVQAMYNRCSALEQLPEGFTIPDAVTDCSSMFAYCTSLTGLPEGFALGASVTTCASMFTSCIALTALPEGFTIPATVTNCSSMFAYCWVLEGLPDGFAIAVSSSAGQSSNMFKNCYSLTEIPEGFAFATAGSRNSVFLLSATDGNYATYVEAGGEAWDGESVVTTTCALVDYASLYSYDWAGDSRELASSGAVYVSAVKASDTSAESVMNAYIEGIAAVATNGDGTYSIALAFTEEGAGYIEALYQDGEQIAANDDGTYTLVASSVEEGTLVELTMDVAVPDTGTLTQSAYLLIGAVYEAAEDADSGDGDDSGDDSDDTGEELDGTFTLTRIGGETRYATAALEALCAYDSADTVILATGTGYADALTATSLAGALDAPILLTKSGSLSEYAADAIEQLGADSVIVVGGTSAVSSSVVSTLEDEGLDVERISGSNRYETAGQIYLYGLKAGYWDGSTLIVASGTNYADALSISPVAYAGSYPILLANSAGDMPFATDVVVTLTGYLGTASGTSAVIVGGTSAVSEDTQAALEDAYGTVTRLGGETRYETSALIAQWAVENEGLSWNNAAVASGRDFPDALAGSALQGMSGSVLLLVADGKTSYATELLAANADAIGSVRVLGGESAVSDAVEYEIVAALGWDTNDDYKTVIVDELSDLAA